MTALEPRRPQVPSPRSKDEPSSLVRWVERVGPVRSMGVGLGLATAGVASAILGVESIVAAVLTSTALTAGAGLFALGLLRGRTPSDGAGGSGPSRVVLEERARRVRRVMHEGGGAWTFELLQARLGWTERAVVEALVYMRDRGELVEDLDLETGKWVYRPSTGEVGEGSSTDMTLDDRLRRLRDDAG